jgi:quercetin dioxygenase-like cupin family protein
MILSRGRRGGQADWQVEEYTGGVGVDKVWYDNIITADDPKGLRFDSVFCPPGKRTLWHRRQGGEVMIVTSGQGRVAAEDGLRTLVQAGDAVYFAPGERHWHGAGPTTFLHYLSRSVGSADYSDAVEEEEYLQGFSTDPGKTGQGGDGKRMIVSRGRLASKTSSEFKIDPTRFPGGARQDWIIRVGDGDLRIVYAYHDPDALTCWHTHDEEQIMYCVSGEGRWGAKHNGVVTVHTVRAGDTAYFPPKELHFQAASPNSFILEMALVAGVTRYYDLVTEEEFNAGEP